MAGFIDPHLQASEETQSRHPHHEEEPPASFRRQQVWVAVAIGIVILGFAFYLVLR